MAAVNNGLLRRARVGDRQDQGAAKAAGGGTRGLREMKGPLRQRESRNSGGEEDNIQLYRPTSGTNNLFLRVRDPDVQLLLIDNDPVK